MFQLFVFFLSENNFEDLTKVVVEIGQGWQRQSLSEPGEPEVVLHHRDPIQALASLFAAPNNAKGFKLASTIVLNNDGERVFSTPHTCEWWEAMEVAYLTLNR